MLLLLPLWLYLIALFIAPQLWLGPFLNLRVDLFIYPLWLVWLAGRGRLGLVFAFRAQDWFILGFITWVALSLVANQTPAHTALVIQFYFKWFVLYRLTAASIDSIDTLRKATHAILVVVGVVAIEAIQHLHSPEGRGWAGQTHGWVNELAATAGVKARTRWVGIFDGPGVFAVMFTIALPFALQYIAPVYGKFKRMLAVVVLLPLYGYAVFSTGSRGGFLATIAVLGLWVLSRYKVKMKHLIMAGVVGSVGLMLAPAYLTSTTDSNRSAQHRVDMWGEGVEMVEHNPLFGIGRGNFARYTGKLIAHNSGIEVMGETGLVGLFLWVGASYMGFRTLLRRSRETTDPRERELLLAVGLCLVGYLVSSLFVTLEYETLYFIWGLMAGVRNFTEAENPFTKRDAKIIGTIVVGYFVAVKGFVMLYY
ncbi:MAG: O-antigen ligase family protein [Pseudomonadota bacterium]